jgi:hypothetical protein
LGQLGIVGHGDACYVILTRWSARMVVPTRTKINLGFALALTFLAVMSVFTYRESLRSIEAVRVVNNTHETVEKLSTILSLVLEAETARRGYLLTGDRSFLDRYDTIPTRLTSSLQRLRELTAGRPDEQARLDELEPLIRRKLENLATSIQLRQAQGTATADQDSMTQEGRKLAHQIEFLTGELQAQQRTLLTERTARSQVSARRAVEIALLGSFLALVTILISLLVFNIDMGRRQRAEEALRTSEERYHALFEKATQGILVADPETKKFLFANPAICRMLGCTEEELIGLGVRDIHPPEDLARVLSEIEAHVRGEKTTSEALPCLRKDGGKTYVDITSAVLVIGGKPRSVSFFSDVTGHKQAEQSLREAEEEFRSLFASIPLPTFLWDLETLQYLEANDAALAYSGYSRDELLKMRVTDLLPPEAAPAIVAQMEVLGTRPRSRGQERHRLKDGRVVDVEVDAQGLNFRGRRAALGVIQDITERERAEEALIEERSLLHTLMDNLPDHVYFKDCQSRFIRINKALADWFGLSEPAQAVGKTDFDFFSDEHARQAYADEQEVIRSGQPMLANEEKETWPDGRETWVSTTKMPLRDAEGRITGTFGVSRDITAHKRAEEALIEERSLLHSLMDNLPDHVYFKDCQSRFIRINKALADWFGLSEPAQAVGKTDFDFFSDEHARQAYADEQEVIRSGQPMLANEEKETWPDGRETWVSTTKMPLRDAEGRITGTFGVSRDITAHKRAEQALQESEESYRDLAESAAELIQSVSPEGRFQYVNRAWRRTLGYSEEEVPQLTMMDVIDTEHLSYCQELLARVMRGEAINDVETVFVTKTGKKVAVHGSVNCRLVDGKPVATRGIFRDVTARLEIERMKDEFVSTVSHELRTPLTSIRGALGLLAGGVLSADPAKTGRMLDIAVANTDRLIRLINDILDIERIESGRVKLEKRSCSAAGLMVQAVEAVREVANKAGVKLELFPTSGNVVADSDRIVQTLTNLLGNAIKFSLPSQAVTLSATRRDDEMLFEVKDQGRGIPADKLGVIFERFQQVDASNGREKGGTGLGLAICRSIVDQHGGRIWVESELGQGSSFYFTLPLVREEVEILVPEASPTQRTVLICDDDPSIRVVVKTVLEQHDYRVLAVGSGVEAIQQAAAWRPDVILLDLLMPEMDGWETLGALRDHPETSEIPVIILSVLPPRETRKSDGEVAGWVQKPIDEARLFQTLSLAISRSSKQARVLVVEDDLDLARVIQEVFERHGNKVFHAQTGREAIQSAQRVLPNLVVLDLILPEGDGFEVVAGLRHSKSLRSVPLVVYTAKDIDEAERERLKLGETLFLTKGRISPEEFEKLVIGLLDRLMAG